jgi:hypothetical protein
MALNDDEKGGIAAFMRKHPEVTIRTASTMHEGFAQCISPIRGICGAEIMCSPKTKPAIVELLNKQTGGGCE